jgi:hypothetical protein
MQNRQQTKYISRAGRFILLALKLLILKILILSWAAPGQAQYQPIPNYTGIGAGQQFRNDINNHLSGKTAVSPRLVSLPFAQLPTETDGQMYWCQDCQLTVPCTAGGTGGLALGSRGQWSCAAGASAAGPAGNDLSGSYPNPTVSTVLNGKTPLVQNQRTRRSPRRRRPLSPRAQRRSTAAPV